MSTKELTLNNEFKNVPYEIIRISSISGNIIDQVTFEQQTTDLTYGRYPNGTGAFEVMIPTYAAQNSNELGIEVIQEDEMSIRVYPNPAEDFFMVEIMNQSSEVNVDVYDLLGKSMLSSKMNHSLSVPTADWPSGLYMVRVGNTVQKVMVR